MINPDNTVNSKSHDPKGIERASGAPDRSQTQKSKRRTDGVFERKKSKEELAEEWEEVKQKSEQGTHKTQEKETSERAPSLFDLARSKPSKQLAATTKDKLEIIEQEVQAPEDKKGSLFELATSSGSANKKQVSKTAPSENTNYVREVPDLSHVNLNAVPAPEVIQQAAPVENAPSPSDAAQLKKIIDEIVEHLYQLEKSGESSLIIVINDPKSPFHKTSIKVTEFDSAKGQLNITIDNLKPDAKALVEKQQSFLLSSLEQKGYQVQQFIATTAIENPRFNMEASRSQDSGNRESNQESGEQNEKEPHKEQQE